MSTSPQKRRPRHSVKSGLTAGFATDLPLGEFKLKASKSRVTEVLSQLGMKATNKRQVERAMEQAEATGQHVAVTLVIDPVEEGSDADAFDTAIAAAKVRGRALVADILRGDDMMSADEFATLIGTSRETVNQKRKRNEVIGLEGAKRGFRFPRWQVSQNGQLLPRVDHLFDALGGNAWTVYRFLRQPHPELNGQSGLDALLAGQEDRVIEAAKGMGMGSFS